ncbi:hypothetical protein Csp1_25970 [Corynebacterium provencense]|uniref:DUF732 domain-containing protein n=1 Tax=Corynebacterium provencense TaxID=1737425 RepID=A0A2Z3YUJ2_9CORY|nr:hypothetical protein [Corynebacterium provencense]AWT27341.1 hypothetical protein Csp1_25970 [Corynebacterium provencense]
MITRVLPRPAVLTAALAAPVAATALLLTACGGDSPMNQAQACDFLNEFYYDHLRDFESDDDHPVADHLSEDLNRDYKDAVAALRDADEEGLRKAAEKMPSTTGDLVDDTTSTVESAVDRCPSLSDPDYGSTGSDR